MRCPKCGSEHVQFATHTSGGGVSFSDACCGYILMGPLGLLCGMCGSGVSTEEFWICHDCGNRFSNKEGVKNLRNLQERRSNYLTYKAQIASIAQMEGNEMAIRNKYTQAKLRKQYAEEAYRQTVDRMKASPDLQLQKAAKKLSNTPRRNAALVLILIGIVLLFMVAELGAIVIGAGILLAVSDMQRAKHIKSQLVMCNPQYAQAAAELNAATAEEKRLKDLVLKLDFIERYEKAGR